MRYSYKLHNTVRLHQRQDSHCTEPDIIEPNIIKLHDYTELNDIELYDYVILRQDHRRVHLQEATPI
jgi:hypothetical protein